MCTYPLQQRQPFCLSSLSSLQNKNLLLLFILIVYKYLNFIQNKLGNRDSKMCVLTRLLIGWNIHSSIPSTGKRIMSFSKVSEPALGLKWTGCHIDRSPPPNAKVKNEWSYLCFHSLHLAVQSVIRNQPNTLSVKMTHCVKYCRVIVVWFSSLWMIYPLPHCIIWYSQNLCGYHKTHDKITNTQTKQDG
jgi:hypothetical protein